MTAPSQVGGKGDEPAFPVPNDANVNGQSGLTIRQYYKAAALTGIISAGVGSGQNLHENIAHVVAKYADAMLAEDAAHASKQEHPNAR